MVNIGFSDEISERGGHSTTPAHTDNNIACAIIECTLSIACHNLNDSASLRLYRYDLLAVVNRNIHPRRDPRQVVIELYSTGKERLQIYELREPPFSCK